jgi:hypothetical protein
MDQQRAREGKPMFTVRQVLLVAKVSFQVSPRSPNPNVFLTRGDQIIGTFTDLFQFRVANSSWYMGWHRHHIVEKDTWTALGMTALAPPADDQPCVLLPEGGHARRINSILQRYSPKAFGLKGRELRNVYKDAYDLMGRYTPAAPGVVKRELMDIVNAEFQLMGVP